MSVSEHKLVSHFIDTIEYVPSTHESMGNFKVQLKRGMGAKYVIVRKWHGNVLSTHHPIKGRNFHQNITYQSR
jgi:hypothetical protein